MDPEAPATLPCGDSTRMGRVFSQLEPRLNAVARRLLRNREAAADAVQSAFEKILRYCEQFRGKARPSTWMHRIVVNEAFMWLRREKQHALARIDAGDWDVSSGPEDDPEKGAVARQEQARLERALASLSEEERSLLREATLHGRPYEDLGREIGLSAGGVKSRVFRIRRRLAAELEAK